MGRRNTTVTYTSLNKAKLIHGGKEYFDLLINLINQATESIHLQAYIFDADETGTMVAEALKEAARKKVCVHLMVDGFASQALPRKFIAELEATGIQFRFFEPFFKSKQFYFGRRLHHKVFVVDANIVVVGGINISNRYNDISGERAWFDFALYAEGEIARELFVLCLKTWNGFSSKKRIAPNKEKQTSFDLKETEQSNLAMRRNDWLRKKNEISSTYKTMFRHSKSHITIMCSYFLPGHTIRTALKNAARRGVKIQIITAGKSDVMTSKYAERWMYDWILRNKIEIFEYQPTILHAKVAVCDGEWMTIGSYNINDLSAHASIELNIDVHNTVITKKMESLLKTVIEHDCIAITEKKHKQTRNIIKQFVRWCSYEMLRFILYIVTFNLKK